MNDDPGSPKRVQVTLWTSMSDEEIAAALLDVFGSHRIYGLIAALRMAEMKSPYYTRATPLRNGEGL
jgi:hypothetical protein